MGLQISRDIHSEASAQDVVWGIAKTSRRRVSQACCLEGESDRGSAFDAWPRAHDDSDTAEVRGVAGN